MSYCVHDFAVRREKCLPQKWHAATLISHSSHGSQKREASSHRDTMQHSWSTPHHRTYHELIPCGKACTTVIEAIVEQNPDWVVGFHWSNADAGMVAHHTCSSHSPVRCFQLITMQLPDKLCACLRCTHAAKTAVRDILASAQSRERYWDCCTRY